MHGPRRCLLPPTIWFLFASTSSPFPAVESVAISHFWSERAIRAVHEPHMLRSTGSSACHELPSLCTRYLHVMNYEVSVLATNLRRVL